MVFKRNKKKLNNLKFLKQIIFCYFFGNLTKDSKNIKLVIERYSYIYSSSKLKNKKIELITKPFLHGLHDVGNYEERKFVCEQDKNINNKKQ